MRSAKDFFKPLAVGAPTPITEVPARPSRMLHFFDPSNEKMAAKVPDSDLRRIRQSREPGLAAEILGDRRVELEEARLDQLHRDRREKRLAGTACHEQVVGFDRPSGSAIGNPGSDRERFLPLDRTAKCRAGERAARAPLVEIDLEAGAQRRRIGRRLCLGQARGESHRYPRQANHRRHLTIT